LYEQATSSPSNNLTVTAFADALFTTEGASISSHGMHVDMIVKEKDHRPLIFKILPTSDGSFSGLLRV
jgi:hypothetical protein